MKSRPIPELFRGSTALFGLVILLLAGCSHPGTPARFRIGFSQCCDDAWRDVMNREMSRELALHPELELTIKIADGNSEQQDRQIRELMAEKVDILIVAPNESHPLTDAVEAAYKSGIPVILIDRKTDSDQYSAYIGADNYQIGKTAASYIADKLNGNGRILEFEMPMTISAAVERHQGFRDALRAYPGMQVLDVYETPASLKGEGQKIHDFLARYPDADVVYGHTDLLAETAWREARKLDRTAHMFFVGIDGIPGTGQGIEAVEKGILQASLLYPTGGGDAIRLALTILNGLPYQKVNHLETMVIHPGNAALLHAQMRKENSLQESIDKQSKALNDLNAIYRNQRFYIMVLLSSLLLTLLLGAVLWRSLQTKQAMNRDLESKTREALEQQRQILAMSEELKLATQAKVDFFTNISHEFRTPLTLILGFTEDLLPSAKLNKEAQESIGFIRQNAWRLLRLVNQLMDFRKIESDKMHLKAGENDLVHFVRESMRSFGKVAEKRGIDFQLTTRHENLAVWFDPSMLDKVLFNLLSNAFKFTPDQGRIHLAIHVDSFEQVVKIRVEDSGTGMTEDEAAHVFDVFYQGSNSGKVGTGLGLSLSKALVELHQGNLSVSSIPGKGSRFTIALPLGDRHLADDQKTSLSAFSYFETEQPVWETPPNIEPASDSNRRQADQQLLVIEDNEELQFFLKRSLGATYQIVQASDGHSGLQTALETVPDLIICDVNLPGMSGLDIVRALKSDLRTSHIPVVLLTARSSVDQQIEGTRAGADAYITKPFNILFLQENIRNLLHNRQLLKESFGQSVHAYSEKTGDEAAVSSSSIDRLFMQKFAAYIETNHARQDFQVTDLCQEMNLSRSQLYRKVKALFGESITDYIQQVRLEKARTMLMDGQLTVAEIAFQVGYSSPDYFSTVFRSRYGVAPTQLKKTP